METVSPSVSFPTDSPLHDASVKAHLSALAIAFGVGFPMSIILGQRRYQTYHKALAIISITIALAGYSATWFVPASQPTSIAVLHAFFGILLCCLIVIQAILGWQKFNSSSTSSIASAGPARYSFWAARLAHLPEASHFYLAWCLECLGLLYLLLGILLYSDSCNQGIGACLLPLGMGTGFVGYGTLTMLCLLGLIQLPRTSTPEHFEGLAMLLSGLVCVFAANTPLLGSNWRALNLGLLWLAGGVLSLTISMQNWIPALREKNIVNALIIGFTGRAVVTGFTQEDAFGAEVHTLLGYVMVVGALTRMLQIVFRKAPTDNLSDLFNTLSCTAATHGTINLDGADNHNKTLDHYGYGDENRNAILSNTYDQLTRQVASSSSPPEPCRHSPISSSIAIICGILTCIMAIASGFLTVGASTTWMSYMSTMIGDPTTYANVILSIALGWTAYIIVLCTVYKHVEPAVPFEYLGLNTMDTISTPTSRGSQATLADPEAWYDDRQLRQSISALPPGRRCTTDSQGSHQLSNPLREPTIRPSEYRAKRRSLLQSPTQQPLADTSSPTSARRSRSYSTNTNLFHGDLLLNELKLAKTSDAERHPNPRRSWLFDPVAADPRARSAVMVEEPLAVGEQTNKEEDEGIVMCSSTSSFLDASTETDISTQRAMPRAASEQKESKLNRREDNSYGSDSTSDHDSACHAITTTDEDDDEEDMDPSWRTTTTHRVIRYPSDRNSSDSHVA